MIPCPACACHVRSHEIECPHCGERLRRTDGTVPRTAAAILLGLTATALPATGITCSDDQTEDDFAAAYGVPDTSSGGAGQGAAGQGGAGGDGGASQGGAGGRGGAGGQGGAGGNQGGDGGAGGDTSSAAAYGVGGSSGP